jgi:8-oxo-dGTP pyrophosphatase MutT (NUDIX family)
MHRTPLLTSLKSHLDKNLDANEHQMTVDTIEFVEANPMCFERTLLIGHITASVWIVNPTRTKTLLTHHRKLNRWFQLGGHCDGNTNIIEAAQKELEEESGLTEFKLVSAEIFDLDVHPIPARGDEPAHFHYDVRYLFEADDQQAIIISSESKDLQWVDLEQVKDLNDSESILRMVRKT